MRITAIDQSLNGSALVTLDDVGKGVLQIRRQELYSHGSTGVHRLSRINQWFRAIIGTDEPHILIREEHTHRMHGAGAQIIAVNGMIDLIAHEEHFLDKKRYVKIPTSVWKKFCFNKGNLKKDTAYMMHLNKFFNKCPALSLEDNFEVLDDNIGDALCLAVTGWVAFLTLHGMGGPIACTSHLEKQLDKLFDYGRAA